MKTNKKVIRGGCLHCGGNEDVLPLDTVLYNGFGGYKVQLNGKTIYQGGCNDDWGSFKKLSDIEEIVAKESKGKWCVILNNPLRGATWTRNKKGLWVLTETNLGFA